MTRYLRAATLAALATLVPGQVLAAQPACITPAEMRGGIAYFLPPVIAEVQDRCKAHLGSESYLLTRAGDISTRLAASKLQHWPLARTVFLKMGDQSDSAKLAKMPDEALRPLVDSMLGALLTIKVSSTTCGEINDITEALAPLDADQTVNLIATVFSTVARKDRKVRSCPRDPAQ
jgi:hypothetical protein